MRGAPPTFFENHAYTRMRNLPRELYSCDMEGELSLKSPTLYQLCSLRQQNLAVDGLLGGYSSTGSEVALKGNHGTHDDVPSP